MISRRFVWTFLLKKVLSELSLLLLYVLISYKNNSQSGFAVLATVEPDITMYQGTGRITRLVHVISKYNCYKRIPAQYDDTGQKQSQLSLHRGMGNDFLFHVQLIYNYVIRIII